jgi:predicted ABC-class ATPase
MQILADRLQQIDGKGYKSYRQLKGRYAFPGYELHIDHVQGDPFADPSRCRLLVTADVAQLPSDLYSDAVRRIALEDFIGRRFERLILDIVRGKRGSGCSGEIRILGHGQQVLRRNAVLVLDGAVDLRFRLGLPANGRRVDAGQAKVMLFDELCRLTEAALLSLPGCICEIRRHVDSVENQHRLRCQLEQHRLCAFVADGSVLPRRSGVDDRPMIAAVPFEAPESLAVTLDSIAGEPIRGLGIPRGVTLIVGGGFHGKSTLLQSIERGVYNHIPGDGRERVVCDDTAVKIRAEDGRAVSGVDISAFINRLPQGRDTTCFSTSNASGSTSQAANIIEALATGASTLLIDEDTSATNFMVRDERMQALVCRDKEPITPLVQRIRELYTQENVSVILVMGGSGEFFAVADQVIMMDSFLARDVSDHARSLAGPASSSDEELPDIVSRRTRRVRRRSLAANYRHDRLKIQALGRRTLRYGRAEIDVSAVEQLVDAAQLRAIGYLMSKFQQGPLIGTEDLVEGLRLVLAGADTKGLDCLTPYVTGSLALPRLYELVATVNRLRGLELDPAE